jgi:hypothetical protein
MTQSRHKGFVLVMVLVLLAVAAAALAEICRASLRNSLAASREAEELQRRWGVISCEATVLPHAEILLQQAEAVRRHPVAAMDLEIELGGQDFSMHVADEQAKLNLNFLYQTRGRTSAESAARVAARRPATHLRVDLQPLDGAQPLVSLGQVFASTGAELSPPDVQAAAADVTCWGDGKLNWRRASATAIAGQFQSLGIAAQKRLIALQSVNPPLELAKIMDDPQIAQGGQKDLLAKLVAEQSTCHSIWVIGHAQSGPPSYDLAVLDQTGNGPARTMRFSW